MSRAQQLPEADVCGECCRRVENLFYLLEARSSSGVRFTVLSRVIVLQLVEGGEETNGKRTEMYPRHVLPYSESDDVESVQQFVEQHQPGPGPGQEHHPPAGHHLQRGGEHVRQQ